MPLPPDLTPEKAEKELLELLRGHDAENFTLKITKCDGRWLVEAEALDTGGTAIGKGSSFAEAWFMQNPPWAEQ
jgi:hypothetical protein